MPQRRTVNLNELDRPTHFPMKSKLNSRYSALLSGATVTLLLMAANCTQAQVVVFDNLNTANSGYAYGENNPLILGDSITLTNSGRLGLVGVSLYNADGAGGVIDAGTMLLSFYDNTVPYAGGTLNNPLLGTATVNWDFTSVGGLQDGYIATNFFDLSASNIMVPKNILVTQEFTETSGTSTGNGAVLFSAPDIGSSPVAVYLNSVLSAAGLYTFQDNLGNNIGPFGYQIQVHLASTSTNPVANPQNVSLLKNTTLPITLTGYDPQSNSLTYQILTQPTNGILTGTAPNVVYHPNTNYVGPDAFTFDVKDAHSTSAPALVSIVVSAGLIIVPTFDSTITSDTNSAAIINTINGAINEIEGLFGDSVTVNIRFQEVTTGLGENNTWTSDVSYSSLYAALTSHSKTTNDFLALGHLPGGSTEPVTGAGNVTLTLPNLRALGMSGTPPTNYDSIISLNMSIINITRTNINPAKYDLKAVAMHEMDEVLGSGSGLGGTFIWPEDLFRYDTNGNRNYTTSGDDAYFSLDGTHDLVRFNQAGGGSDYGDFWSISTHSPVRVQDAYATAGATPDLTVEKTVLDVVGWYLLNASASAPAPVFQSAKRSGNSVILTWTSVAGQSYQLQDETNVTKKAWTNLGSAIVASGSTTTATNTIGPDKQRFYRVALVGGSGNVVGAPAPLAVEPPQPAGPPHVRTRYYLPAR